MRIPEFYVQNGRFLAYGFAASFFSAFGQAFFLALFMGDVRAQLGLSNTDASQIFAMATLGGAVLLTFTGRLVDVLPLPVYTLITCLLMAASALVFSMAETTLVLFLGLLGLRLSGQGMMMQASVTSMARYFVAKRGLAISFASSGFSVAIAIVPVVGVALLNTLGRRATWEISAAFILLVVTPGLLLLLRGHQKRHAAFLADMSRLSDLRTPRAPKSTPAASDASVAPGPSRKVGFAIFFDPAAYPVILAQLALPTVLGGVIFHQVHIVDQKEWPLEVFAAAFIVNAMASLAGSIGSGRLVDVIGTAKPLPALANLIGAVAILILWLVDALIGIWVYMIISGIAFGMFMTAQGTLWPEIYGRECIGSVRAVIQPVMLIGTALFPLLFGVMLDAAGGEIRSIMLFAIGYLLITTAIFLPRALVRVKRDGLG